VSGTPLTPGAGVMPQPPQPPQGGAVPQLLLLRDKGAALPRAGALPAVVKAAERGARSLMDTRHTAAEAEAVRHTGLQPRTSRQTGSQAALLLTRVSLALGRTPRTRRPKPGGDACQAGRRDA